MAPSTIFNSGINGHNAIAGVHATDEASIHFHLGSSDRNSGPLPPVPHAPCHVIPFPPNKDVVDRPDIVARLDQLLPSTSPNYHAAALWGLGGSGKTQVALDFAYRRCQCIPEWSVFWVHADNETTFAQDYKVIAAELGLPDHLDGEDLLVAVRRRIEAEPRWLLVLDNADDLGLFVSTPAYPAQNSAAAPKASLSKYVPRGATGSLLWTSRDAQIVGSVVSPRQGIEVARMTSHEAMELLATTLNEPIANGETEYATKLLEELQWLPLAISQAGAYMRRTTIPLRDYLAKLADRQRRWRVFLVTRPDLYRRPGVPNSILQTWAISIQQIQAENKMAYHMLHVIAYVDSQNIPSELLQAVGCLAHDNMQSIASHAEFSSYGDGLDLEEQVVEAITRLKEFAFLHPRTTENPNRSYEVHKLVQEAAQYGLRDKNLISAGESGDQAEATENKFDERTCFPQAALRVITNLFPERKREAWPQCERYLAHAVRVAEWAEACGEEAAAADLLARVSDYLYDRGRWREKEMADARAVELRRLVLGTDHPATLQSMASLAVTYHNQGRYDDAEQLKTEVLALRRKVLGADHPATLHSMASLAATYYNQGRYDDAEKLETEVLALRRTALGAHHPDTLHSIPDTLQSMAELAATYHNQGRYDDAEKLKTEVLALRRTALGADHPDTLLAECWQGRCRRLGPDHPHTRRSGGLLRRWQAEPV